MLRFLFILNWERSHSSPMPENLRPTIIDVARSAGVSKSTVSRVIRGEEGAVSENARRKVTEAVRALGYEQNAVASSMRTAQTFTVILAIPDITNPFWPDVARGMQDVMDREGYAVVFANSDWDSQRERSFLKMARRNRFDGIVVNPVTVTNSELVDLRIPTVLVGAQGNYPNFDSVGSDSYNAVINALTYLTRLGHSKIGLLLGRHEGLPNPSRLRGYRDFLAHAGLPYDPQLVIEVPFEHQGGNTGMEKFLALPEIPTAVLAANDIIAIGALHAANAHHLRIPQDISIMGIDGISSAATMIPPLTTMVKQKYEIGALAASLLIERLRGQYNGEPRRHLLPCKLVERASTGQNERR